MSKLYVTAKSDSTKTPVTKRDNHHVSAEFLYNFHGGNTAEGGIVVDAFHNGKEVIINCRIIGAYGEGKIFYFHPDGTYSTRN